MFRRIIMVTIIIVMAISVTASLLPSVTLTWDANSEPELLGYSFYIQEGDGSYKWIDDVEETELENPLIPQWTIFGLEKRDFYYFALTSYSENAESDYSDDACGKLIPGYDNYVDCDYQKAGDKKGSSGGGGCFISSLM
jgi:hypothetical protein